MTDSQTMTITPMLARSTGEPPEGAEWRYEPKWDGMRALLLLHADGTSELVTRAGRDIAGGFPELVQRSPELEGRSAVLDGEIVAPDPETGAGSFARLQRRIGTGGIRAARLGRLVPVQFIVFDVISLDGVSLMDVELDQRRLALEAVTPGPAATAATSCLWHQCERLEGTGDEAYSAAIAAGHEGIVAKRGSSLYRQSGRDGTWCKVVRMPREEFVVVGWRPSRDDSARPGALAVASRASAGGPLEYVGMVERGIGERERELLHTAMLTQFSELPTAIGVPQRASLHHLYPELVVEIAHAGSSIDHTLRQPRFLGLRPDRDALTIARDPFWT